MEAASRPGLRGLVDVGRFRYEHADALVRPGELVEAGQPIGWTCEGTWHVHLGERAVAPDEILHLGSGELVDQREMFRSDHYPALPAGQQYAPGTDQNLPENGCMRLHRTVRSSATASKQIPT